jgi:hypothetical protein
VALQQHQTQQVQANNAAAQQNQTEQAAQVTIAPTATTIAPTSTPLAPVTIAPTIVPTVVTFFIEYGGIYSSNPNNVTAEEWTFSANRGDMISITMQSSMFNTRLSLYRGSELITSQSSGGTSTISNLEITRADTYTIVAQSIQETMSGSYNITLTQILPTAMPTNTERPAPTQRPSATSAPVQSANCPGIDTRLVAGERARVLPGGLGGNRIRQNASTNSDQLGRIPENGIFDVLEGPDCNQGYAWWRVRYDGITGWTAEGDSSEYYVEPIGGQASLGTSNDIQLLMNGTGQSNRRRVSNGEFQVEYYCSRYSHGNGISNNNNDWWCTRNGTRTHTLRQSDFNQICRDTYNVTDAVARQDGSGSIPAFRWRCYG